MYRFILKHKGFFFFIILSVVILFLVSPELPRKPISIFEKPLSFVFSPIEKGSSRFVKRIKSIWYNYIFFVNLREDYFQVKKENEELREEIAKFNEVLAYNKRLEELLDFKSKGLPYTIIPAQKIGGGSDNWSKSIIIDKGENDGIKIDMGVITPVGVVGKIIKVLPGYSLVLLMLDRNSEIPALIQRTRDEGIIEGTEKLLVRMKYLPYQSEVKIGDVVVTSGIIEYFPKGLVVGRVTNILKNDTDLFKVVEVMPEVNYSRIEEVLVIKPNMESGKLGF